MAQSQADSPKITLTAAQTEIGGSHDFQATALIESGASTMEWNAYLASIESLSLEIQDAKGASVPHLPPPVPEESAIAKGRRKMAPGESESLSIQGLAVDHDFLENGSLKVRFVLPCSLPGAAKGENSETTLYSNWLVLEVKK